MASLLNGLLEARNLFFQSLELLRVDELVEDVVNLLILRRCPVFYVA